jgi:hypothetical protein
VSYQCVRKSRDKTPLPVTPRWSLVTTTEQVAQAGSNHRASRIPRANADALSGPPARSSMMPAPQAPRADRPKPTRNQASSSMRSALAHQLPRSVQCGRRAAAQTHSSAARRKRQPPLWQREAIDYASAVRGSLGRQRRDIGFRSEAYHDQSSR